MWAITEPVARVLLFALVLSQVVGCAQEAPSGPAEMVWDRDACERCNMAISDRQYAAQVRSTHDHRIHKFDELGCALLWMDEQAWRAEGPEEIWVRERGGTRWLDARRAAFVPAQVTPMNYGFAAVEAPAEGGVDLETAHGRIREVERERRSAGR